jgi:hypothetical protein
MIAQTIAHQLGVPTLALLGAHTLVDLEDGLQFRIRGCSRINVIQIILDPCDTYTVKFGKLEFKKKKNLGISYTEATWQLVSTHSDIYCDMLHDLIEQQTGLYTTF